MGELSLSPNCFNSLFGKIPLSVLRHLSYEIELSAPIKVLGCLMNKALKRNMQVQFSDKTLEAEVFSTLIPGPATGKQRILIRKENERIINVETGGSSLGNSYSKGNCHYWETNVVYVLMRSYELKEGETELAQTIVPQSYYLHRIITRSNLSKEEKLLRMKMHLRFGGNTEQTKEYQAWKLLRPNQRNPGNKTGE